MLENHGPFSPCPHPRALFPQGSRESEHRIQILDIYARRSLVFPAPAADRSHPYPELLRAVHLKKPDGEPPFANLEQSGWLFCSLAIARSFKCTPWSIRLSPTKVRLPRIPDPWLGIVLVKTLKPGSNRARLRTNRAPRPMDKTEKKSPFSRLSPTCSSMKEVLNQPPGP